jgi:hypothetical protein
LIVVITAALRLTVVVFVAAHSTPVRFATTTDISRFATTTDISFSPWAKSRGARVRRLTLLAPDIIEMVLNGTQSGAITLKALMRPLPSAWKEQTNGF